MPSCYTGAAFRSLAAQAPRTIRLSRRRTSSARPMRVEVHCAEPSTAFQRMPRAGSGKLLIWSCSQTYLLPRPAVLDGKRAGQGMSRSAPWRYLRLVLGVPGRGRLGGAFAGVRLLVRPAGRVRPGGKLVRLGRVAHGEQRPDGDSKNENGDDDDHEDFHRILLLDACSTTRDGVLRKCVDEVVQVVGAPVASCSRWAGFEGPPSESLSRLGSACSVKRDGYLPGRGANSSGRWPLGC
jgi:hypothetical protein